MSPRVFFHPCPWFYLFIYLNLSHGTIFFPHGFVVCTKDFKLGNRKSYASCYWVPDIFLSFLIHFCYVIAYDGKILNSVNFLFRLLSVSHFDFWVVKLSYLPCFLDLFIPHRSNWNWRWGGIKTYHNLAVKHSFWGKREPGLQSVLIKLMWLAYIVTKIKCCFGENFRINKLMYECPKKNMNF